MSELSSLTAISPLDGRYRSRVNSLAPYVSEYGLVRFRVQVEVEWFLHLASSDEIGELPALGPRTVDSCRKIWRDFSIVDAELVANIEKTTNHDVKAVEYFVKERLQAIKEISPFIEFVHFACTSEDINNLAYAVMLKTARDEVLLPSMKELIGLIRQLAADTAAIPMLSRTHGQSATPTTVGKELANFIARLERQLNTFESTTLLGKFNGAVGNYNAHVTAYPNIDWPALAACFVEQFDVEFNAYTTQIEPHDYIAEYFDALARFNQILIDFDQDIWGYISIGYFRSRLVQGETGSSTMPHKVNPIDFENSEGNLGLANAIMSHLGRKLVISRWQRDLSDSTALRSIGTCLAHSLVAYTSTIKGLRKLEIDLDKLASDLEASWEVLTEAVQTAMRKAGMVEPYEQLKALARGRQLDETLYKQLIDGLELTPESAELLKNLTPSNYTGLAYRLAEALTNDGAS